MSYTHRALQLTCHQRCFPTRQMNCRYVLIAIIFCLNAMSIIAARRSKLRRMLPQAFITVTVFAFIPCHSCPSFDALPLTFRRYHRSHSLPLTFRRYHRSHSRLVSSRCMTRSSAPAGFTPPLTLLRRATPPPAPTAEQLSTPCFWWYL